MHSQSLPSRFGALRNQRRLQTPVSATPNPDVPNLELITRLREEEFAHGQVMDIMAHLTDEIGPRLTGSPNMKKANEWTREQLTKWGLVNAHLEPWGASGRGWAYQRCEVRMVSPDPMQFLALPKAWTPGTDGPIRGEVTQVIAKTATDFNKYRGKLSGKIVLLGEARIPDPIDKPLFHREEDADLRKIANFEIPTPFGPARRQEAIKRFRFQQELAKFLTDEHVAVALEPTRPSGRDGTIFVEAGGSYEKDKTISVPRIALAVEHFGRMARLLASKVPVEVEVNVETRFYDDDDKAYNTVAEIQGTDPKLKEQLVMLGGHMDSWHAAEGATDNGAGTAVALEVVRLLTHLAVQPRRTIRIALWSGEEQGLLGSRGYVKEHFGSRPENTEVQRLAALPASTRRSARVETGPETRLRVLQP